VARRAGGEDLWVVRKGATPAFPGRRGFVGGSMGDISVIIEGVANYLAPLSLYSAVHGAGRIMGRMEAKGKYDRKTGVRKREGKVTQAMMDAWTAREGVELRGGGRDFSNGFFELGQLRSLLVDRRAHSYRLSNRTLCSPDKRPSRCS